MGGYETGAGRLYDENISEAYADETCPEDRAICDYGGARDARSKKGAQTTQTTHESC